MLREIARSLLNLPGAIAVRAKLKSRPFQPPRGAPVLAFGGSAPGPGQFAHGGRVKLGHLQRAFPTEEARFNILYLASSAIPNHAAAVVEWALANGAALVWNQNGVGFPAWAGSRTGEVNRPMAALMKRARFVIYQSAFCRESAERWLGKAGESAILYNPVDLAAFVPNPNPPARACARILAAGTHNQPERVMAAIETLRQLRSTGRNASLTIAGKLNWRHGAEQARLAVSRAKLEEFVSFHPPFTQAEAIGLLQRHHLLLHAKYHDPCPTMVIEALACGIPVIGSRSGGMPELVETGCGELLDVPLSWDKEAYPAAEAFVEATERVMSNWDAYSRKARQHTEARFDLSQWIEEHRRVFKTVLSNAPRKTRNAASHEQ